MLKSQQEEDEDEDEDEEEEEEEEEEDVSILVSRLPSLLCPPLVHTHVTSSLTRQ